MNVLEKAEKALEFHKNNEGIAKLKCGCSVMRHSTDSNTNIILQNQIDMNKNARWIRAALSRICVGDCWLRAGVGKIRSQAQTLFPKLSQIVRQTKEIQLIVEALDHNLPRLLTALAEYTTDEEISELSMAVLSHVECSEPAVRPHLCSHREPLLTNVLARVYAHSTP